MPHVEQIRSQTRSIDALNEKMQDLTAENSTLRFKNDDLSRENKTLLERLRENGL